MRKIPSTMASQHPDHASVPYWHTQEFISVTNEHTECYLMFSELGIQEYKWDWEGKLVDESVMERLLSQYYEYFKKYPLGREKFLTFRLPNPKAETVFRLARAFINILSASALANKVGVHTPPLFEVILPMTESAEELIAIQEAFKEISELKHLLYRLDGNAIKDIEVIPLFEQVSTIIHSDEILKKYLELYQQKFNKTPQYLRPYMARSDPALNSGLVPTVLAVKIALSHYKKLSKKLGIELYPIIGCGSLPFRGGLSPLTAEDFAHEYAGVKTVLLQSAFRYDYKIEDVKKGIEILHNLLPQGIAKDLSVKEEKELLEIIPYFENAYKSTVEEIAPLINTIASYLPKRRERVQHIGLFGYSRGVGKVTLPRAISFTAALYSIGIPPELIGSGRGIKKAQDLGKIKTVEKYYLNLRAELIHAGRYVNKENLRQLIKDYPAIKFIKEDIKAIEAYLGEKLGPATLEEKEHQLLTSRIYEDLKKKKSLTENITKAAILRRSLG